MKNGGGSESTIIIGPSGPSFLVYELHILEYVLGLARFRVFVPKLYYIIYYYVFYVVPPLYVKSFNPCIVTFDFDPYRFIVSDTSHIGQIEKLRFLANIRLYTNMIFGLVYHLCMLFLKITNYIDSQSLRVRV